MALEFICFIETSRERINLPRVPEGKVLKYALFAGEIKFFYDNLSEPRSAIPLGVWTAPDNARYLKLDFYNADGFAGVIPVFFNMEGNTLKIGNH